MKPQPKRELTARPYAHTDGSGLIYISVVTQDAEEWIKREARSYGRLSSGDIFRRGYIGNHYELYVPPEFSVHEVAEYLNSYNRSNPVDEFATEQSSSYSDEDQSVEERRKLPISVIFRAMKKAVEKGIFPEHVDQETYIRNTEIMKEILEDAINEYDK